MMNLHIYWKKLSKGKIHYDEKIKTRKDCFCTLLCVLEVERQNNFIALAFAGKKRRRRNEKRKSYQTSPA
jgi:hypothetical protein